MTGWEHEYDIEGRAREYLEKPLIVKKEPSEEQHSLPDPVLLGEVLKSPPQVAPVLIDGVLRQGHKMIISAPSKAGKSFALMELAVAIAEGMNWMGIRCKQGKVLYINMEIDDPSCYQRFQAIYGRDGLKLNGGKFPNNITVWGLRGFSMPIDELAPEIIRAAGHDYSAIIIDPLYKVMSGDENSNSDVGKMVSQFDRIARETGASVIYAHHFAKGNGGDRSVIDRAAGAGAFARDPDAILTMTEIDTPNVPDEGWTAWRIEFVLREFPFKDPLSVWWKYPIHEPNEALDGMEIETSATKARKAREKASEERKKEQVKHTIEAAESVSNGGRFLLSDFKEAYASFEELASPHTLRARLRQAGYAPEATEKGTTAYWRRLAK